MQIQSRSLSDPSLSGIYFISKMAWVWTILKISWASYLSSKSWFCFTSRESILVCSASIRRWTWRRFLSNFPFSLSVSTFISFLFDVNSIIIFSYSLKVTEYLSSEILLLGVWISDHLSLRWVAEFDLWTLARLQAKYHNQCLIRSKTFCPFHCPRSG